MASIRFCPSCERESNFNARGLCKSCYGRARRSKTLDNHVRIFWKNSDLIEEYNFWVRQGLGVRDAAEKIGVKVSALRRAIQRAKERANDVRVNDANQEIIPGL